MDIIKFTSPGKDQFGRKFLILIKFKDGTLVYGHVLKSLRIELANGEVATREILFRTISDLDAWQVGENPVANEIIQVDDNEIEAISNFKDY